MTMTPAEIAKSYREAKDRRVQIGILADLNACKHNEIVRVILDAGELTEAEYEKLLRKKPGPKPKSDPPEAPPKKNPPLIIDPPEAPREGFTRLVIEPPAPPEQTPTPEPEELDHALAEAVEAIAEQVKRLRAERDKRLAEARTAEKRIRDMYRLIKEVFAEGGQQT